MDFQVGDKVVCLLNGKGIVCDIVIENIYSVKVRFDNEYFDLYTKDGKVDTDNEYPCLFHEGTEINIKPVQPKRYPWVTIYILDGMPKISAARDSKEESLIYIATDSAWEYVDTIQLKPKGE